MTETGVYRVRDALVKGYAWFFVSLVVEGAVLLLLWAGDIGWAGLRPSWGEQVEIGGWFLRKILGAGLVFAESMFAGLAVLILVVGFRTLHLYYRRLCLIENSVTLHTLSRHRTISYEAIRQVIWSGSGLLSRRKIILMSEKEKIKIVLNEYAVKEQAKIIATVRNRSDAKKQVGWDRFMRSL